MNLNEYLNPATIATLQTGGYFLMFGLMVVEGPLVTIAAAFLASLGFFDIYVVALLGWAGDFVGDMLFFSIGRYGLKIFQKKTEIDTSAEKSFVHKLDALIHENLLLSLFLIKFTPYAPPIGLTYIGRSDIALRKYISTSFLSSVPIPLTATLIGFKIGYINSLLQKYTLEQVLPYIFLLILVMVFGIIGVVFMRKKSKKVFGTNPHLNSSETEKNTTLER